MQLQYGRREIADDRMVIMDANEITPFENALISEDPASYFQETDPDESELEYRIVYGSYISQERLPVNEINEHINQAVNIWMIHIVGNVCLNMAIEDIVTYGPAEPKFFNAIYKDKKGTERVGFSALACIPPSIKIGRENTQAISAFVRYSGQMDPATNIINRLGLFAFKESEEKVPEALTLENWRKYVDHERAFSVAELVI